MWLVILLDNPGLEHFQRFYRVLDFVLSALHPLTYLMFKNPPRDRSYLLSVFQGVKAKHRESGQVTQLVGGGARTLIQSSENIHLLFLLGLPRGGSSVFWLHAVCVLSNHLRISFLTLL